MIARGFRGYFSRTVLHFLALACALASATTAEARSHRYHGHTSLRTREAVHMAREMHSHDRYVWCVPFARVASGVDIHGDARTWWAKARDRYRRDHTPQVGAVMTFRPTRRIPLGHVAVVAKVISPREILVNQANWHRNRVTLGTAVVDVSPRNDWSEVRVADKGRQFGSVYPVEGFILAHGKAPAPEPIPLASAQPELRPAMLYRFVPDAAPARKDAARIAAPRPAPASSLVPRLRPAVAKTTVAEATEATDARALAPRRTVLPRLRPARPQKPVLVAALAARPELRPVAYQ